ncbi:MAG: hypothetical protein FJ087_15135 [Deltaproteobacteria bacterium]|nr:hypothetical protein [Deltaproteobacteria bacterium]
MAAKDAISAEAYLFIEVRDRVYRYRIEQAVTSIGAAEDNVVRIREPSVARHHMLLTYVDGRFHMRRVEDSPVRLNGERVEGFTEELRYGDLLGIGDVRLRLAEGGRTSDTALMIQIHPHVDESVRPWQLYLTRRTEVAIGDAPADLLLPGAVGGERFVIENFGSHCQYLVPPEKGGAPVNLNETPVARRTRLKDRDTLRLRGYTLRLKLLRAEVMDDPEGLLWPEVLRRHQVPEEPRG